MDYLEDYRLIKCLREGLPTDMNVYDAAALSAVVQLSERSNDGEAGGFPRLHAGRWRSRHRSVSFARKRSGLTQSLAKASTPQERS